MKAEHNEKIASWKRMQADHPHGSGMHGFWEGIIEGFKEGEDLVVKQMRAMLAEIQEDKSTVANPDYIAGMERCIGHIESWIQQCDRHA